jgi:hypothetical protein
MSHIGTKISVSIAETRRQRASDLAADPRPKFVPDSRTRPPSRDQFPAHEVLGARQATLCNQQSGGSVDRSDPMGDALGLGTGARALVLTIRRLPIDARWRRVAWLE